MFHYIVYGYIYIFFFNLFVYIFPSTVYLVELITKETIHDITSTGGREG